MTVGFDKMGHHCLLVFGCIVSPAHQHMDFGFGNRAVNTARNDSLQHPDFAPEVKHAVPHEGTPHFGDVIALEQAGVH